MVVANESFERVASVGLRANMILYLKNEYHFSTATGANIMFLWGAISGFMPTVGAFLSDSYLGRFRVIAIGSIISLIVRSNLILGSLTHIRYLTTLINLGNDYAVVNRGISSSKAVKL